MSDQYRPGRVEARGPVLILGGRVYDFAGVDAYELGSWAGVDRGCGTSMSVGGLDRFFSSLPSGSMVRVTATQGAVGLTPGTDQRTWRPLDRLVRVARAHGDFLILVLGAQDGTCDDQRWHGPEWYRQGYRYGGPAGGTSYVSWVEQVVARYGSDPTVAMWEPVNEPEAATCDAGVHGLRCYGRSVCIDERAASAALVGFFGRIGAIIHGESPGALVESGTIGSGQCGTEGRDALTLDASSGVDVLSLHDYGAPGAVLPGDRWNGERVQLGFARRVDKPLVVGEIGIRASQYSAGCATRAGRLAELEAKVEADLDAGASGALVWDWVPRARSACTWDVGPGDPLMTWLRHGAGAVLRSGRLALAELLQRLGQHRQ